MSTAEKSPDFKDLIAKVANGEALSEQDSASAFQVIMSGDATPSQIGGFLMALRVRGETVAEITGAARIMREKALKVDAPEDAIDIVGTGGDGTGTYNISTATTFVVAGLGVPIAKHGNKALSSKAGAADVLTSLGINIDLEPDQVSRCISETGVGFMMAPRHHGAMRHVGPTRVELGTRTIFNLLGPLSNPAQVKRQMTGVFAAEWVEPLAHVFANLGLEAAWVVHGSGLDEITTTGVTNVAELKDGKVRLFDITPEEVGLERVDLDALKGGDPEYNAKALRALLEGDEGPYRDVVLMNAAASLIVAGQTSEMNEGVALAAKSIDSGAAAKVLDRLIAVSNEGG